MTLAHSILLLDGPDCEVGRDLAATIATTPGVTRIYVARDCEAIFVEHDTERFTRDDLRRLTAGRAEVRP